MAPPVAAAGEVTFTPAADSFVDSSKPTRNFGSRNDVRADASPTVNAYLRFNISGVSDFTAARLRLYFRSAASQGVQIRSVGDSSWGEATITWNNAPEYGPVVATSAPGAAGVWLEIGVSSLVTQNGLVSFAITNAHTTAVAIRSRESAQAPQLIVGTPAPNQNPVASFTYSCVALGCSFDASGSSDPDGTIVNYAWQFGGDGTASGAAASHNFSAAGAYDVALTVTDDRGGTGSSAQTVIVTAPSIGTEFVVTRIGGTYQAASSTQTFTGSLKYAVESAVAQLQIVSGGTITFTAGDFDLGSDWFELFDIVNITFQGAGMGQTIIRNYTGAATDTEPFDVTGADYMVVRDLTVNAGGPLRSTSDALDFDRGNHVLVERVEVTGSRARGIIFDGKNAGWTSEYNTIRDCVVTSLPGKGIELLASSHNLIEGCMITNVGSHGIQVNKSSTSAPQSNKPSTDNVIRNNSIDRAGEYGIYINSGDRNAITGNVITNSSQAVSGRDGIRISSSNGIACNDNVVAGNVATDNQAVKTQAWGLRIASAACNRTVVGGTNSFAGNLSGPILDQGTGTIYPPLPNDNEAPSAPTGLAATVVSGCRVDLFWTGSTDNIGVAGYGIYRDSVLVNSVDGSTLAYTDRSVSPGLSYSYQVDAFDAAGNRSAKGGPVSATTPSAACSLTLVATADSYVEAGSPATNNGTKTQLRADGSPVVTSYLKFDAGVGGTITRATLRIWVASNHSVGFDVHAAADSNWMETGITYANAPSYGGIIGSSGSFTGGSWVEVDVTSIVTGGGEVTFALTTTSSTAMSLASRETGASAPQLLIEAQ